MRLHIIALTRAGAEVAERLSQMLPGANPHVPVRFLDLAPYAHGYSGPVADTIGWTWEDTGAASAGGRGGLVLVMAAGVAVRLIAPLLLDKRQDPAVVVVDDQGQFAISLLSGHLGGGNALAQQIAGLLGGQAVVTTASDGAGTIAVDLLGRELGWSIDPASQVTAVSAAVVNGEPVALLQEAGETGWRGEDQPLPSHVTLVDTWGDLLDYPAALVITDQLVKPAIGPQKQVIYRPKSLVVGIGCNRGTTADEIERLVFPTLLDARLAWTSVRALATVEQKRDEAGITEFATRHAWPVIYFSADELNQVEGLPNPSPVAERELGARGVCEPAALLGAGAGSLLVEKRKRGNVTVALARIPSGRPGAGRPERSGE